MCDWGDPLIDKFDILIRLVTPTETRIERLKIREFQQFGIRIRKNGDMYSEHQTFLQWASEYDSGDCSMRSKAKHDDWSSKISCKKLCLDGTASIDTLLKAISNEFNL